MDLIRHRTATRRWTTRLVLAAVLITITLPRPHETAEGGARRGRAAATAAAEADPAEVAIGERLFLETRFAQFFFANAGGVANAVVAAGDPVMNLTKTIG